MSYANFDINAISEEEREVIEAVQMHAAYLELVYSPNIPKKAAYYITRRLQEGWSLSDFHAVLMGAYRLKEKGLLDVQAEKMGLGDFFTPANVPRFLEAYYQEIDGLPEVHRPDESPEKPVENSLQSFEKGFQQEKEIIKKIKGLENEENKETTG